MAIVNTKAAVQPTAYEFSEEKSSVLQGNVKVATTPYAMSVIESATLVGSIVGLTAGLASFIGYPVMPRVFTGITIGAVIGGGGAALVTKGTQSAVETSTKIAVEILSTIKSFPVLILIAHELFTWRLQG